jgi:hypothetical protein
MFHNQNNKSWFRRLIWQRKNLFHALFIFFLGSLVFILTLIFPLSEKASYMFRHGFSLWLLGTLIILILTLKFDSLAGRTLAFCLVLLLFALPLNALWRQGYGEMQIIGGLLSFSDSARYYQEASRLLSGFPLTGFGARHPFFPAILSTFLWMMGHNLQITLAFLVFLASISVFFAARSLQSTHGPVVASLFILFSFLFYRRFIGMTDTENLGFILGMIAFTLLWHGASNQNKKIIMAGLFFSSIALNARPGPFFILPTLLIWFIVSFFKPIRLNNWQVFSLGSFLILLPFIINLGLLNLLSDKADGLFSNYAYTLYGISDGGSGWEQIYSDHPEILELTEHQAANFAYQQAIKNIREDPKASLQSVLIAYKDFFSTNHSSAYGFLSGGDLTAFDSVKPVNIIVYRILRILVWCLFLLGLSWLYKERKRRVHTLLLWAIVGIIISVPFLPPRDAAIMRVYAASIPFIITIPLMGLNWFLPRFRFIKFESRSNHLTSCLVLILGIFLFICMIVIPVGFRLVIHQPSYQHFNCQNALTPAVIKIYNNSYIVVREDQSIIKPVLPKIKQSDFIRSLNQMPYGDQLQELTLLEPPFVIMNTLDLRNGQLFWAIMPSDSLIWTSIPLGVCGIWLPELMSAGFGFLLVESYHVLE